MTRDGGAPGGLNPGSQESAAASPEQPDAGKSRPRWPLKTAIEILPIIIALTAIFSYSTIKNTTDVDLVTPLEQVLGGVPLWVAGLMGLVTMVGVLGMGWLIYVFSRAPVTPDGSSEE